MAERRTIAVDYLARVEGEGGLHIVMKDGRAEEVKLRIFEAPRLFESFLRGRGFEEAPDITARICGICPVAYQMSACSAMEDAFGVVLPDELRALRRLLYCGEWIESHALHMFMLHAPDFLGCPDAIVMAERHRDWVTKGLAIKKAGNALVSVLGGREIHPINVRVGGFYRLPPREAVRALLPSLERSLADARAALEWMAGFDFPDLERDYELVAMRDPARYPFCEGRLVSNRGLDIAVSEYPEHFEERHVEHSNALHSVRRGGGAYFVGPLARLGLNFDRLGDTARASAEAIGYRPTCKNPFKSLLARGIELVQALDEAVAWVADYEPPSRASVDVEPRAGTGHGCSEAPRGILYHRYTVSDDGAIEDAVIIPPTSQNQLTIEDDLRDLAPTLSALPLAEATLRAEQAVRNYDPCISCATHFLTLKIEHR